MDIPKPFLFAGEDIIVNVLITKNCPELPLISTTIMLTESIITDCYKLLTHPNYYHKILKRIEVEHLGINKLQTTLSFTGTFSTTPDMFTKHSQKLRTEFVVEVILNFSGLHDNMFVVLPIAIAKKNDEDDLEKKVTIEG